MAKTPKRTGGPTAAEGQGNIERERGQPRAYLEAMA